MGYSGSATGELDFSVGDTCFKHNSYHQPSLKITIICNVFSCTEKLQRDNKDFLTLCPVSPGANIIHNYDILWLIVQVRAEPHLRSSFFFLSVFFLFIETEPHSVAQAGL